MKRESLFQRKLIAELRDLFPGCIVLKNDANYLQGVPDLIVLYEDQWATLEVKRHSRSANQPNQEYYVDKMNEMSFSAFISPENQAEVLHALQQTFQHGRVSRLP